jgi:hypothetical protein
MKKKDIKKRKKGDDRMKSLSVRLAAILVIGFVCFAYAEAWGADWSLFSATDKDISYYDKASISHPSKNVIRVWNKTVLTEKGLIDMVGTLGKNFERASYLIDLWEINCTEKMFRILTSTCYSKEGEVVYSNVSTKPLPEYRFIVPESVAETLIKEICK